LRIWQKKWTERHSQVTPDRVEEILKRALKLKGLDQSDVEVLMDIEEPELLEKLFVTAERVKEDIYGRRIVLFAPLYISNYCQNECLYCSFRASNRGLSRVKLSQDEILAETEYLVRQGHKRVLMVAGRSMASKILTNILESIRTIYSVHEDNGEIRRVNVNVAPLDVQGFKYLKQEGIGTYQIFQETYHPETYANSSPCR
jgi:2-iminoacetate synthase